jgi:hypothetical protein
LQKYGTISSKRRRRASNRNDESLLNILAVETQRSNVLVLLLFALAHAHYETGQLTCSVQRENCSTSIAYAKKQNIANPLDDLRHSTNKTKSYTNPSSAPFMVSEV